jgi:hypothetical protein
MLTRFESSCGHPRMHGIHHSVVRDETNSNYSVVFSWWDRLHRTLRLHVPQNKIRIGVAAYTKATDNRVGSLIGLSFQRQRLYWKTPEGQPSHTRANRRERDVNRLMEYE